MEFDLFRGCWMSNNCSKNALDIEAAPAKERGLLSKKDPTNGDDARFSACDQMLLFALNRFERVKTSPLVLDVPERRCCCTTGRGVPALHGKSEC